MNEKKEDEDDEAYFLRKLEEAKKKKSSAEAKPALIVQEHDDEFGRVEVWSTNSRDEEVRRPIYGMTLWRKWRIRSIVGSALW